MSAASGQLVAKLILTGDAKGVVGAGKEAEAALDGVNAKAKQTNATVGATPAQFDAAAVAIKGQTDATAKATAAITASGAARTSEVARLRDQGAAAESTIAKVQALSKAHAEYNATIASARAMVAAKTISEAEYTTLASAASAKLAADLAAVRVEASASGMALDRLEANLAKLGRAGGVSRGAISRVRGVAAAVPEFIGAFPVISAAAGAAAAIGVLIAAEQTYEASIGHLNVTLQAHGLALASTNEHYLSLAGDVAAAAKTSTISAREMEASFANSHLDTSLWTDVAAMSRDYAAVLGTDIPAAAAKAAENLEKPYEWAVQLTQQYGLFDQATLKQIRDLEEQGRVTEAQKIITDGWSARIKNAADQTSGWARAWNGVSTAVSSTWDAIGKGIFGSKSEELKLQLKNAQSNLDWRLNAKNAGYKMANLDDQIAYYRQRVAEIEAKLKSIDPNIEKRNRESAALSDIVNNSGLNTYDQTLRRLRNERQRIVDDYANGIVATGNDGKVISQKQALADKDRDITKAEKDRAEAERNLNQVEKDRYEQVQQLLKGAPQLIAQSELETKTAQGRALSYLQGSSALAAFNDQQEVTKATLPYTTALAWAQGTAHDKLADTIARVTKEKKDQLAADHALAAMQDIDQQIGSASGYMSNAMADAKLALGRKQLDDWYNKTVADLAAAGMSWEEYGAKLNLIMGSRLVDLYEEDTRNRRDWTSGIIRANQELTRSQEDWASRSHDLLTEASSEFETDFVSAILNSKDPLSAYFAWFEEQLVRLAYQKYMAGTMNSIMGGVVDVIGSAFGMSGGYGAETVSMTGVAKNLSAGVNHLGGGAGASGITRQVPASLFYSALRYHKGGDVLSPGEVAIIAKDNERVQTSEQAERSDAAERAVAYISEMARPVVMMLPPSAAQSSAPPNFSVKIIDNAGVKKTTSQPKQDGDGAWSVDVIIDLVDNGIADRNMRGTSAAMQSLESTHGVSRRPG